MKSLIRFKLLMTSILFMFAFFTTTSVFAQFSGGDGTEGNPYIITTATQLAQLATYVNEGNNDFNDKHYKLDADLDLSDYSSSFNDGEGWIPIGFSQSFTGVFDGNNKKITNLYINIVNYSIVSGLFGGVTASGTIKNLGVENADITSFSSGTGCVVGYNSGTVTNCYSTGIISESGNNTTYTGGVVGNNTGIVSNCYSNIAVTSSSNQPFAGGVVGYNNRGVVSYCYSTGTVTALGNNRTYSGGVVGNNDRESTLSKCYSSCTVTSEGYYSYAGGVVGHNFYNCSVLNCYSTGDVNALGDYTYAGGVAGSNGYLFDFTLREDNNYGVFDCYSTGKVTASGSLGSFAGGVIGCNSNMVSNCYSISSVVVSGSSSLLYAGGIVGLILSQGIISNCAALNPDLTCNNTEIYFGRVVVPWFYLLINNIAFNNMLNPNGDSTWDNKGHDQSDGADFTVEEINADATLGGRFTIENGWTTQNGKLPGLFGKTVNMPDHLGGTNISNNLVSQKLIVYAQNGKLYINGLIDGEKWYIYDLAGRLIYENTAPSNVDTWHAASLQIPAGIYIIQSKNEKTKIVIN